MRYINSHLTLTYLLTYFKSFFKLIEFMLRNVSFF